MKWLAPWGSTRDALEIDEMQTAQVPAFAMTMVLLCTAAAANDACAGAAPEQGRRDSAADPANDSSKRVRTPGAAKAQSELFESRTWNPPPPAPPAARAAKLEVTVPPFRYQYIGRVEMAGKETLYLTKDDQLYSVAIGDALDGAYRIDDITAQGLALTYMPLNKKQFVAYSSMTAPAPSQATIGPAVPSSAVLEPPPAYIGTAPTPNPASATVQATPPNTAPATAGVNPNAPTASSSGTALPSLGGTSAASVNSGAPAATPSSAPSAAAAMGVSPATAAMPVAAPTITSMPVLSPGADYPLEAPSGAPMVVTPPAAR